MSRTFNNPPRGVPSPSKTAVEKNFFTHINWKGLDKNKNFLAVDQETFADCNNVYVNDAGILRSRPSVKRSDIVYNDTPFALTSKIKNAYTFNEIYVLLVNNVYSYELYFFENTGDSLQFKTRTLLGPDEPKFYLCKVNDNIFIFTKSAFRRYDLTTGTIKEADDCIYVPETVVDVAGVDTKIEKPNVLTTAENVTYLYNPSFGISSEVYGKNVSIELDGKTYNLIFNERSIDRIVNSFSSLEGKFANTFQVSSRNTFLKYDEIKQIVYYSIDGITIAEEIRMPDLTSYSLVGSPKFSQDGNYIFISLLNKWAPGVKFSHFVFIRSVVSDTADGSMRFPDWTDVRSYVPGLNAGRRTRDIACDFISYDKFLCSTIQYELGTGAEKIMLYNEMVDINNYKLNKFYIDDLDTPSGQHAKISLISCSPMKFKKADAVAGAAIAVVNTHDNLYKFMLSTFDETVSQLAPFKTLPLSIKSDSNRICIVSKDKSLVKYSIINASHNFLDDLNFVSTGLTTVSDSVPILSDDINRILISNNIYYINENTFETLLNEDNQTYPLAFTDYIYYLSRTAPINPNSRYDLKTNRITESLEFKYKKDGKVKYILPQYIKELDNHYVGLDKTLYISDYREKDGKFLWYLPEHNVHYFDANISGLHPISDEVMCVFCNDDSTWYISSNEGNYFIVKSKVELSVPVGGDILTSYDGQMTMFCSKRGFVALAYQNFVSSTEQAITFLSDTIYDEVKEFIKSPVKLYKKDFWVVLYNESGCYIFDIRGPSWWPMKSGINIDTIFELNKSTYIVANDKIYLIDNKYEKYYDVIGGTRKKIDWFVTSQKLHLFNLNAYKHIYNITFTNTIPENNDELYHTIEAIPLYYALTITNYRKFKDINEEQVLSYSVESIRTYVQRLNYMKVNEFQYKLSPADSDTTVEQIPLSLTSICVKYKFTGGVR